MKYKMIKPLGPGCVFNVIESNLSKKQVAAMIDAMYEQHKIQYEIKISVYFNDLVSDLSKKNHHWRYYSFGVNASRKPYMISSFYYEPFFDVSEWEPEDFGAEKWAEINEWFCKIS